LSTAIFVTRLLVDGRLQKGHALDFSTGATKNLFRNLDIRFLQKRFIAYAISGSLIAVAVFSLFTNGLNQGVDFVGGRSYTVRFEQAVNPSQVQTQLASILGSAEAKTFGEDN
jgi:SecD/SecF fusion protein